MTQPEYIAVINAEGWTLLCHVAGMLRDDLETGKITEGLPEFWLLCVSKVAENASVDTGTVCDCLDEHVPVPDEYKKTIDEYFNR